MPDPHVSLPAKVVKRGAKYAVVDANGKALPGTGTLADAGAAGELRDRINGAWERAKSERRGKGSPEITREARVLARSIGIAVQLEELAVPHVGSPMRLRFDPSLHRRNRLGEFAKMAEKLKEAPHGSSVELPSGVTMRRTVGGFTVSGPGGMRRPGVGGLRPFNEHLDHPHAAAALALRQHDIDAVTHGADPDSVERQTISDLNTAARAAAASDINDRERLLAEIRAVRQGRSERQRGGTVPPRHGRSKAALAQYQAEHHRVGAAEGARNLDRAFAAARQVRARKLAREEKVMRALGLMDAPTTHHV